MHICMRTETDAHNKLRQVHNAHYDCDLQANKIHLCPELLVYSGYYITMGGLDRSVIIKQETSLNQLYMS